LISWAHALIKQQVAELTWNYNWHHVLNDLALICTLLCVYLSQVCYKDKQVRQEACLKKLIHLVCSTLFLRKLLAKESSWSKTIVQQYELFQVLADEAHCQDGWIKQGATVVNLPRVALFGDGLKTQTCISLRGDSQALKKHAWWIQLFRGTPRPNRLETIFWMASISAWHPCRRYNFNSFCQV
jgi:cytochrome c oxidase assembly factor CtaG